MQCTDPITLTLVAFGASTSPALSAGEVNVAPRVNSVTNRNPDSAS